MPLTYEILGNDLQCLQLDLNTGQSVHALPGAMAYMDSGIEMDTEMSGGLFAGLKRKISGGSWFLTAFKANQAGRLGLSSSAIGKIHTLSLEASNPQAQYLCQQSAFLCSEQDIAIDVALTRRIGSGLFGGAGFILQALTGSGLAFVHCSGAIIEKKLAEGESIYVDSGCLVAFSKSVDYDVKLVRGLKNMIFAQEGLFLAHLRGPGMVFIQSLPAERWIESIAARLHKQGDTS